MSERRLSNAQQRDIRNSIQPVAELARVYNVTPERIRRIKRGNPK